MDKKIAMLIVENRDYILTEYMRFMMCQTTNKNILLFKFWYGKRKPIWFMRREMIIQALKHKEITHICFIDTDVIPPPDYLDILLKHDKDIVTGVYYDTDRKPCSLKNGKHYYGKGLEKVDVGAMGLSLLKREVCEKVNFPEPDPINKIDGDAEFFRDIKKAGYTIYQDFNLRGTHLLTGKF